jgi:predicted N-acyltransferase
MHAVGTSRLRVLDRLADVREQEWDALLDEDATPFLRWAWLEALESTGCAAPATGWRPRHLTLWRGGRLVAAAPAFAKDGSDGDFSRDWDIAAAAARARRPFYPKLVLGVPFAPCAGRRLLVARDEPREACEAALLAGARDICRREGLHVLEVLFPTQLEAEALERVHGLALRVDFQFHWRNEGYRSIDDFLARFSSKRRAMIRREMAAPAAQALALRTVEGPELARDPGRWAREMQALHRTTIDRLPWGRAWIGERFYEHVFARMPESVQLVVATRAAERDGRAIAAAFNVVSARRLFGRTWGCREEHPFLHFNVCLYHSIARCIDRGLQVFEGGAGGEHKLWRGFLPTPTWVALQLFDPRLDAAVRAHLDAERSQRLASARRWIEEEGPFKRAPPEQG